MIQNTNSTVQKPNKNWIRYPRPSTSSARIYCGFPLRSNSTIAPLYRFVPPCSSKYRDNRCEDYNSRKDTPGDNVAMSLCILCASGGRSCINCESAGLGLANFVYPCEIVAQHDHNDRDTNRGIGRRPFERSAGRRANRTCTVYRGGRIVPFDAQHIRRNSSTPGDQGLLALNDICRGINLERLASSHSCEEKEDGNDKLHDGRDSLRECRWVWPQKRCDTWKVLSSERLFSCLAWPVSPAEFAEPSLT